MIHEIIVEHFEKSKRMKYKVWNKVEIDWKWKQFIG